MKFDFIIGNPPYNRGLVKKDLPIYNHPSIGSNKLPYVAFIIKALELSHESTIISFIIPATVLAGKSKQRIRSDLIAAGRLDILDMQTGVNCFGCGLSRIIILNIDKSKTGVYVNNRPVDYEAMPDKIIPLFKSKEDEDIYLQLIRDRGILSNGGKLDSTKWVVEVSCMHFLWRAPKSRMVEPGLDVCKWFFIYPRDSEAECKKLYDWLNSELAMKLITGLFLAQNVYHTLKYLPGE